MSSDDRGRAGRPENPEPVSLSGVEGPRIGGPEGALRLPGERGIDPDRALPRTSLAELAALFLRLGATSFGGPAAHLAMLEAEVVRRRGWLTGGAFLDLLSATNLIPGPNSTEMAMHVGWVRRGFVGLVVAGTAFIVPAALMTGALGWAYVRYGALPEAGWISYGIKPVMVAVVVQALWGLAPKATPTHLLRALALGAATLSFLGGNELSILFGTGAAAWLVARFRRPRKGSAAMLVPLALPAVAGASLAPVTLPSLFGVFLKIGSVLFGSGYVLLAFLRAELVEQRGWLTGAQLLDAIAAGQITPGPVFTTATFIGYVLAGPSGAAAATVGIFLPAFVFVALSGPLVPRLRGSPAAAAFLDGLNAASLALMAVVTVQLGQAALVDVLTVALAVVAAVVLVRFKPNATWLVLGGAAAGFLAHPRLGGN